MDIFLQTHLSKILLVGLLIFSNIVFSMDAEDYQEIEETKAEAELRAIEVEFTLMLDKAQAYLKTAEYTKVQKILEPVIFPDVTIDSYNVSSIHHLDDDHEIKNGLIQTLLASYWEQGDNQLLLTFASKLKNDDEITVWKCRVFDRTSKFETAADCWNSVGEIERSKRSSRLLVMSTNAS